MAKIKSLAPACLKRRPLLVLEELFRCGNLVTLAAQVLKIKRGK
jgi:hypothetical protein